MSVAEILNEVKKLSPVERLQVIEALLEEAAPVSDEKRDELYRRLIAKGILKAVPPRKDVRRRFEPVTISGKPLSETIIEERG